ncbi:MAG: Tad domain-containing protein [Pseudomonadota bacterium]
MNTFRHSPPSRQTGVALLIFTIAMVVIIGVAGLALDMAHAYLNKTRLQNALDAAALSGAKTLNEGGDVTASEADARTTFQLHLVGEMGQAGLNPIVEFSDTLQPFVSGGIDPRYVRVREANFAMPVWFARVLPGVGDNQQVGASAVAGPSPPLGTGENGETCDIAPMLICGDGADQDCSDGACYGYDLGAEEEIVLKTSSATSEDWEVGPGNFQLIQLDCGPGGDCVREELAGGFSGCLTNGDTATTKPGNNVGPVAQGFNTRFGIYQGAGMNEIDYPPDVVTYNDPDFWHLDYLNRLDNGPYDYMSLADGGVGVPKRRIMAAPIGDCTGTTNGQGEVTIWRLGCFFMTRPASHSGNTQEVYGQLVEECEASGTIAENPPGPGTGPTLFKIILYKDPDSIDS